MEEVMDRRFLNAIVIGVRGLAPAAGFLITTKTGKTMTA
ncbi:hypothetical protein MCP1_840003 [Candidatus Terasakiella magnetica]|nr:hypothetical protein MCP1_840003 [Candidatus Terasakiella magnetica]